MANPPTCSGPTGVSMSGCCTSGLGRSAWSTRSVPTPARLMSHEPSGLMAWATHRTALHAWTRDAGLSFVATL